MQSILLAVKDYTSYAKGNFHLQAGRRKDNVEMYSEGRYFIMTGNQAGEYENIVDCTESVKYLHAKYIGTTSPANTHTPVVGI